jgi:UDP-2,4-diacetamido-2,4,6-trideoxy-beta-L-altropyranose hydrolase
MMSSGNLLIRCDASVSIGTGHAMRCLALGQAWQDAGGHVVFVMAESTPAVERRIVAEKMGAVRVAQAPGSLNDAESTLAIARQHAAKWIVVDGYVFGAEYQARVHEAGLKLLIVDDDGRAAPYIAEIALNSNPLATEALYRQRGPSTKLLLGPRYVLLRREFAAWRLWKRKVHAPAGKLLVTMGGSDPENITLRVVEALIGVRSFDMQIVVGGSNPHLGQLRGTLDGYGSSFRLVHDASEMAELMAWADVAISAAGTAAWEMAFMGLPPLLIVLADNQEPIAQALSDAGAALNLGPAQALRVEDIRDRLCNVTAARKILQEMSTRGRALIDGCGADRVVAAMQDRRFDLLPAAPPIPHATPNVSNS